MISIVVPLYNKEDTIGRAIESILAQSSSGWELIVVDDGSTDNSLAMAGKYVDARIRVISQANAGVSAARNQGVSFASNSVVAFLDADDYWSSQHLASIESLIEFSPGAVAYSTAYFVVNEGQSRKSRLNGEKSDWVSPRILNYFADALDVVPPVISSAVAIRMNALTDVGGFPIGVRAGEDLITWARLACLGEIAYSTNATSFYIAPPVSAARSRSTIRRPATPDYVGSELKSLDARYGCGNPSLAKYRGEWYRMRATLFLELDERIACLAELTHAVRASGVRIRDVASLALLMIPTSSRARLISLWRMRHRTQPVK